MDAAVDRIEREREFHNARFADETRAAEGKFYAAIKRGAWAFEQRVRALAKNADVLEYGCGADSLLLKVAGEARTATGIDISDVGVQEAEQEAATRGLTNMRFQVMNAEAMTFPDDSFDLVFGRGILHHLNLEQSYRELARVLRPGGRGVFWEPLGHNLALNLYRKATPLSRTVDEHPMLKSDFELARRHFGHTDLAFHGLTTIATVPIRDTKAGDALLKVLCSVDELLFATPLKWQAWHCRMEFSNPTG